MSNARVNLRPLVPLLAVAIVVALLPAQLAHADEDLASEGTQELCSLFEGQVFADVGEDNPFSFWITCIAAYGVAGGFTDGTYRSGQDVSRDQMSTFVVNAVEAMTGEELDESDAGFGDVDADNPHRDAINKLANAQIVDGFDDDTFRPRNDVRRDQMAKFIVGGIERVIHGEMDGDGEAFADVDEESPFFDDIDKLATAGIVDGFDDDTYRPRENVNRGQMAKFVGESMGYAHAEGHFPRQTFDVALSWVNVVDDGGEAPLFAQGEEGAEAAAQVLVDAALDCVIHVIDYAEVTGPFGSANGFVLHQGELEENGPGLLTLASGEDLDDAEDELQQVVCEDTEASLYDLLDDPESHYVQLHSEEQPEGAVRGQLPDGGQDELPEEFQDEDDDDGDDGDDDDDGLLPIPIPLI